MKYKRPKIDAHLTKQDKIVLMRDFVEYYRQRYASDHSTLNRKVPREAFAKLTDAVGSLLLKNSARLADTRGPASKFLHENPVHPSMCDLLPKRIRAFCLGLNALKQWVSAEQKAMDRLILGGNVREICRAATSKCIVTGKELSRKTLVLHHPVRDGRPPLPLSKQGHAQIEDQTSTIADNPVYIALYKLKRARHHSWVQLRRGCLDLLERQVDHSTPKVAATSRTFARKASQLTGLTYAQLLKWLEKRS